MIQFVSGDLLQTRAHSIALGVPSGAMDGPGTILSLKIAARWPEAHKKFKKHTRSRRFEGGELFAVRPSEGAPGIIYLATQPDVSRATLELVGKSLRALALHCALHNIESVALPKIGSGQGKLAWDEIKPLMLKYLSSGETLFCVYEDFLMDYDLARP